jgi:hypothetical protein
MRASAYDLPLVAASTSPPQSARFIISRTRRGIAERGQGPSSPGAGRYGARCVISLLDSLRRALFSRLALGHHLSHNIGMLPSPREAGSRGNRGALAPHEFPLFRGNPRTQASRRAKVRSALKQQGASRVRRSSKRFWDRRSAERGIMFPFDQLSPSIRRDPLSDKQQKDSIDDWADPYVREPQQEGGEAN